ncbi:MAG: Re/Si-specific NAD(P)(+) transhydrogenase subunit alpha, partial [Deltaproteobacteria bacterium]|nr:Re/Si-specific NAD(P)(+) transhydrogenase subunit alpha [Deltaproteobacteria bacterium]
MKIGIIKEIKPGERRVAATPETVGKLGKLGFAVTVESGAGEGASFRDEDYEKAGAQIEKDTATIWSGSDIILKVQPPDMHPQLGRHEAELLREKATLVSFLWPGKNRELIERLAARKATVLAMDLIPRITRAQKMDALSSMANIAGYRAVIEAASFFGRFFTGQVTAAGKVPPAKVMVIGAGVAGLAAIGAARGLGAIVRAFDTRPVVREQVQSMGAEFLEVELAEDGTGEGGYAREMSPAFIAAEMALFEKQAREVDIIITTALIPGRAAPQLILR